MTVSYVFNILLVAFAFGFVIFWHELGHFLAARWAGVRVEQFAVGMGQAIFSWRKGVGFRPGNTQTEFDRRVDAEIARRKADLPPAEQDRDWSLRERYDAAADLGLGDTDYRFNWIPLGGYVKPTGQDDLRPAAEVGSDDPHAFGAKPVGKRMVIISAGVVMNVILAFALYVALFLYGFNAPPAVVGQVLPGSPAQAAGLMPGDRIVAIDGHAQQDFTKLRMNTALLRTDEPAVFTIDRPGHGEMIRTVFPAKNGVEFGMASIGISAAGTLEAAKGIDAEDDLVSPAIDALPAGSRITVVDGKADAAGPDLVQAVDAAAGRPVPVTIKYADGSTHDYAVQSTLVRPFNTDPKTDGRSIGGMLPRVIVTALPKESPALKAGLKPGDVIAQVAVVGTNNGPRSPSFDEFLKWTTDAGKAGKHLRLTVERDGIALDPIEIDPTYKIDRSKRGIGVVPDVDLGVPVVAGVVPGTWAATAGVQAGDRVTAVNGNAVTAWSDVLTTLRSAAGDIKLDLVSDAGEKRSVTAKLSPDDIATAKNLTFLPRLPVAPLIVPRHTANPLVAASWGYEETKASVFQVYVTLRRLFEGQVPLSNLSGPVGIFTAGTSAASRGIDWLIWFTALISANLAVVNFLPIPIVDGGLFAFLVAEKITGRPPSPRVQTAAQLVGIVLLGSLFLFVTYHDILRQWG